jgi:hypothetical protein
MPGVEWLQMVTDKYCVFWLTAITGRLKVLAIAHRQGFTKRG